MEIGRPEILQGDDTAMYRPKLWGVFGFAYLATILAAAKLPPSSPDCKRCSWEHEYLCISLYDLLDESRLQDPAVDNFFLNG